MTKDEQIPQDAPREADGGESSGAPPWLEKWTSEHKVATVVLGGLVLIFVVILANDEYEDTPSPATSQGANNTSTTSAKADPYSRIRGEEGFVSKREMADEWPLTVPAGVLSCKDKGDVAQVVTFEDPNGKGYALNGSAKSLTTLPTIDPIWAPDPDIKGLKVNIGPLIDRGLALC